MNTIDQQFIEYIVKSLVGKPDAVKVERRIDEKGVLLELSVDPEDLGRVIGKRGATAQSLRTLLRALGTKNDARYNLKIIDDGPAPAHSYQAPTNDQVANDYQAPSSSADDDGIVADSDGVSEPDETGSEPEITTATESEDVLSKTRKELEDLDDLDV